MRTHVLLAAFIGMLGLSPATRQAATVTMPNTFVNGTVADAGQVNANFNALVTAVNQHATTLNSLQAATSVGQKPRWAFGSGTSVIVDYMGAGQLQEIDWFVYDVSGFTYTGAGQMSLTTTHTPNPSMTITVDDDAPQTIFMKNYALTFGGYGIYDSVDTVDDSDPMGPTGTRAETREWATLLQIPCRFKTRLKIEVTGMRSEALPTLGGPLLPVDFMGVQYVIED